MFLDHDQIGIIPPEGYGTPDLQSTIALCWLDWTSHAEGVHIQHANGGEYRIEGVKVDGFDAENNTVLEFHGCVTNLTLAF